MKLIRILLLTLLTIDVFAQSDQRGQNIEELKQLYFGIDNIININGLGIDNPFVTSPEANVTNKNGSCIIRLKLPHREIIHIDIKSVVDKDTVKFKSYELPEKSVPVPSLKVNGIIVKDSVSRQDLLKSKRLDIGFEDEWLNKTFLFELISFDITILDKDFYSNSKNLNKSILYWISQKNVPSFTIKNDLVQGNISETPRVLFESQTFYIKD